MAKVDRRSPEAALYRQWYKLPRWAALRHVVMVRDQGLCQPCLRKDRTTAATVVHHKVEHKGDAALFWNDANCEAVCKPCHDGPIQSEERLGYSTEIGADGWPVDARHPANASS